MREQRGKQAAASFLFKLAESVGTQGISFVVSVVLARLLDPSDYGVLTMLTVFIAVSQVFVQSGLNTALIQKKDVDETDLSSVFYVSLGIAVVLIGVMIYIFLKNGTTKNLFIVIILLAGLAYLVYN